MAEVFLGATFDGWSRFISRVGFPIVVTFILLFQLVPKIDHQTEAMDRLDSKLTILLNSCQRSP